MDVDYSKTRRDRNFDHQMSPWIYDMITRMGKQG